GLAESCTGAGKRTESATEGLELVLWSQEIPTVHIPRCSCTIVIHKGLTLCLQAMSFSNSTSIVFFLRWGLGIRLMFGCLYIGTSGSGRSSWRRSVFANNESAMKLV